jgi:hypothetical protein
MLQVCTCASATNVCMPACSRSNSAGDNRGADAICDRTIPQQCYASFHTNRYCARSSCTAEWCTGTLSRIDVRTSLAPAMDIGVPYNIERMLHLITGGDTALVASLTRAYYDTGTMVVPVDVHNKV